MDFTARNRHEMLDAMESCRADSEFDDREFAQLAASLADDAELRVHFQRVQQSDTVIKTALLDVPVPADLAARVLHRLEEAAACPSIDYAADGALLPNEGETLSPVPLQADVLTASRRVSRRRILTAFATLSASAAVAALIWFNVHQPPPMTHDDVLAKSMAFFSVDNDPPGKLVSEIAPPAEYPISRDLRQSASIRWRRVASFLGGEAVAYDLPAIGGRATLYVVRPHGCRLAVLSARPARSGHRGQLGRRVAVGRAGLRIGGAGR